MAKDTAQEKIKKLEDEIAKKKAALLRVKGQISEKDRKAKTRRLIEIGSLAETAEVLEADSGFLLGLLLEGKDISPGSPRWKELKGNGDPLLKKAKRSEDISE
jgi:hypothetical protein